MGLPATFVGFSGTDIRYYWLMKAWKANEKIDFDFRDCQLQDEIDSENEVYIKFKCRRRIVMASRFIMLIGEDTRYKYKYVRWEAEVAIEKGCTIVGVNLRRVAKDCRSDLSTGDSGYRGDTRSFFAVHYKYASENYRMHESSNYHYSDDVYGKLGY